MIVMHYSFTLPADYDMTIIERRIAENGAALDGFPDLYAKAYLYARRDEGAIANRYAPLYLWHNTAGLTQFLRSAGFARLIADFGWPALTLWLSLRVPDADQLQRARFASLQHQPLHPGCDLTTLGPQADLTGWNIQSASLLNADFAADQATLRGEIYRIGYLACGKRSGDAP
ncbi:DUF4865 family protein [Pantoea sp. KPR_PJ]|uniref:DUF4865 family protein n=1 Tax=Pantoea sp. KPR_PJ TaxID=2738375 RepID=UPI003527E6FF